MSNLIDGKQKAVAAFIVTLLTSALSAILVALQAAEPGTGLGDLDVTAWITITLAVLASTGLATGAVYGVENKPTTSIPDGDGRRRAT